MPESMPHSTAILSPRPSSPSRRMPERVPHVSMDSFALQQKQPADAHFKTHSLTLPLRREQHGIVPRHTSLPSLDSTMFRRTPAAISTPSSPSTALFSPHGGPSNHIRSDSSTSP